MCEWCVLGRHRLPSSILRSTIALCADTRPIEETPTTTTTYSYSVRARPSHTMRLQLCNYQTLSAIVVSEACRPMSPAAHQLLRNDNRRYSHVSTERTMFQTYNSLLCPCPCPQTPEPRQTAPHRTEHHQNCFSCMHCTRHMDHGSKGPHFGFVSANS